MKPPVHPVAKPPRLWLGPGLLLAIVASFFVWRSFSPAQQAALPSRSIGRVAGGESLPSQPPPTAQSAPDPKWLLRQKSTLKLSAPQQQKLARLAQRYERETKALQQDLKRASDNFQRGMAQRNDVGKGVTMRELQERAAPVSELSRQLAAARRAWWDEASQVLSAAQRQRARELWQQHLTRRFSRKEPSS